MRQREGDTLATVHDAYLATIKDKNKSWPQADKLMRTYVLPTLGKRKVKDITRADVWKLFDSSERSQEPCQSGVGGSERPLQLGSAKGSDRSQSLPRHRA